MLNPNKNNKNRSTLNFHEKTSKNLGRRLNNPNAHLFCSRQNQAHVRHTLVAPRMRPYLLDTKAHSPRARRSNEFSSLRQQFLPDVRKILVSKFFSHSVPVSRPKRAVARRSTRAPEIKGEDDTIEASRSGPFCARDQFQSTLTCRIIGRARRGPVMCRCKSEVGAVAVLGCAKYTRLRARACRELITRAASLL